MPRRDNFEDDDDRPRRNRGDDDHERPSRNRQRRDDGDEEFDRPRPRKKSNLGLILGILGGVLVLLCAGGVTLAYFAFKKVKDDVVKALDEGGEPRDNFVQIGKGFHNHDGAMGSFPQNSYDRTGQPLLSWRVHLLPYVGQQGLYSRFNLNEPWNSPTNIRLLNEMPAVYGSPSANQRAGAGKTFYRGFSQQGAMFEKPRPGMQPNKIGFAQMLDGTSNTILIVEASDAVEWTKPDDMDWSPGRVRPSLGRPGRPNFHALMGDASVRLIKKDVAEQTLRFLIDRQDGNAIPPGWEP